MNALIKPVPDDKEQLSAFGVYKQKPLVAIVQQDANSGRALSHMNIAHDATVEKCVSEMKQNGKLKTLGILKDHDKEDHVEITSFSGINFNAKQ